MENDGEEVARFWRLKERELGEAVVRKSICHTYHATAPDSFGILYASDTQLVYEYTKGSRRSFLDVLLARKREEEIGEAIRVPRADMLAVGLVPTGVARRWLRSGLPPAQAGQRIRDRRGISILGVLTGVCLCVCTPREILVLDTPANRQWAKLLGA